MSFVFKCRPAGGRDAVQRKIRISEYGALTADEARADAKRLAAVVSALVFIALDQPRRCVTARTSRVETKGACAPPIETRPVRRTSSYAGHHHTRANLHRRE